MRSGDCGRNDHVHLCRADMFICSILLERLVAATSAAERLLRIVLNVCATASHIPVNLTFQIQLNPVLLSLNGNSYSLVNSGLVLQNFDH